MEAIYNNLDLQKAVKNMKSDTYKNLRAALHINYVYFSNFLASNTGRKHRTIRVIRYTKNAHFTRDLSSPTRISRRRCIFLKKIQMYKQQ